MRKMKTCNAYVDGVYLCDVLEAALDNNVMLPVMKKRIVAENPGAKVEFRVEPKKG